MEVGKVGRQTHNSVLLWTNKGTRLALLTSLIFLIICHTNGFRHSEGLNKWSFLSPSEDHELYSDLLCPNPMVGGSGGRIQGFSKYSSNSSSILREGENSPIPNDIWALKTAREITFLPCDLKQYASLLHNNNNNNDNQLRYSNSQQGRFNLQNASVENRILFMNLTLEPFHFPGAKLCNKFIKLQFDDEDGVELNCDENPLGTEMGLNHIYWPRNTLKRTKSFAIFKNLERFLQNEEILRKKFFFQIYFTSSNGRSKTCTVQQYELNLSSPGCNSRRPQIHEVCGEFNCDELIFPYYEKQKVKFSWKSEGNQRNDGKPSIHYPPEYETDNSSPRSNRTRGHFFTSKKLDIRFIVFITCLPIVLFGMLIFGLELIIYITCLRRSRNAGDSDRDARSQQILQNSLNLWESIPNRESRCVSFSPVTTNIDMEGSESPLPDPLSTPRVLKSALKKSMEHLPPPPPSLLYNHQEFPPTYTQATMNN